MTKLESAAYNLALDVARANPDYPMSKEEFIQHLTVGFTQVLQTVAVVTEWNKTGMLDQTTVYEMGRIV